MRTRLAHLKVGVFKAVSGTEVDFVPWGEGALPVGFFLPFLCLVFSFPVFLKWLSC